MSQHKEFWTNLLNWTFLSIPRFDYEKKILMRWLKFWLMQKSFWLNINFEYFKHVYKMSVTECMYVTSVPLKKIGTCICHWLIVPLLWILWQILISYCKFILPKALKWGILHVCTMIIYQDIPKNKYRLLSF